MFSTRKFASIVSGTVTGFAALAISFSAGDILGMGQNDSSATVVSAPAPEDTNWAAPEDTNWAAPEDTNWAAPEDTNWRAPEDTNWAAPEDTNW